VRLFFSVVAAKDLECHSIDIQHAFIQGDLEQEIYMLQPPGYDDGSGAVLLLNKSLYGLKQAPRVWHQTLTAFLLDLGCVQSPSDGAMFTHSSPRGDVFLLLYVDDIQIASSLLSDVLDLKRHLLAKFPGRDLGETSFFLQMAVQRDRQRRVIVLRQQRHIEKLADMASLSSAWPVNTPMISGVYRDPVGATITDSTALTQYKSLLGALMHIANYTRPDVSFAVSYLARFATTPTTDKFARVLDVIKYLNGTSSFGLYLGGTAVECPLYAYCDSDFAACTATRRSVTGYVVKCGIGSVVWKSARQPTVSRSTAESEYIASGELAKEVQYIHQLACQFGLQPGAIPVGCDNSAALHLIADPISAARTKHIDIIYHHVRERVKMHQMQFFGVPSRYNCSDIFTKPLDRTLFEEHRCSLGVHP
jgi:Reverse transcriptase (RNA-dependent DNA polymerase)